MHKPIGPGAPVSPDGPPATPESSGISGQQTRSHPHHPQTVGSYSTAPREESAQTGDEALHPAKARLLQLLTALQDVKTILDDTKPALSNVESELQARQMRAHQLEAGGATASAGSRRRARRLRIHPAQKTIEANFVAFPPSLRLRRAREYNQLTCPTANCCHMCKDENMCGKT